MKRTLFWGLVVGQVVLTGHSHSHDLWIAEQGLKSPSGQWCCGQMDCGVLSNNSVTPVEGGYAIHGTMYVEAAKKSYPVNEFVPNAEAQPSPDGAYWRCAIGLGSKEKPAGFGEGGERRCFFFPPPNT